MRVEEVAHGRHGLIAQRRVEVADEHRKISTGDLAVELRHREAVVAAGAPARNTEVVELVEWIGIEPEGVGLPAVGAVEQIDPRAPLPVIRIHVDEPFADEIKLVHHRLQVAVLEADRAVEVAPQRVAADAAIDPAVDRSPAIFLPTREKQPLRRLHRLLRVAGPKLVDVLGRRDVGAHGGRERPERQRGDRAEHPLAVLRHGWVVLDRRPSWPALRLLLSAESDRQAVPDGITSRACPACPGEPLFARAGIAIQFRCSPGRPTAAGDQSAVSE
jgi:hypothetical protein